MKTVQLGKSGLRVSQICLGIEIALTPEERASLPAVLPARWVGQDPVYDR